MPSNVKSVPRHIAIIMDGNGRWAKGRGFPRIKGHEAGAQAVRECVEGCGELKVEYLTLYAFSAENWQRPKSEVLALMRLLDKFLKEKTPELIEKNVRLQAIGRLTDLPGSSQEQLHKTIEQTAANAVTEWSCSNVESYRLRSKACMRFENQVAIVTGAGRGIGQAIALQLANEGARIACVSRTDANAKNVANQINAIRANAAKAYAVDVADHKAVQKVGAEILNDFGRVDILVNNAGVTRDGQAMRMSLEDWVSVVN